MIIQCFQVTPTTYKAWWAEAKEEPNLLEEEALQLPQEAKPQDLPKEQPQPMALPQLEEEEEQHLPNLAEEESEELPLRITLEEAEEWGKWLNLKKRIRVCRMLSMLMRQLHTVLSLISRISALIWEWRSSWVTLLKMIFPLLRKS